MQVSKIDAGCIRLDFTWGTAPLFLDFKWGEQSLNSDAALYSQNCNFSSSFANLKVLSPGLDVKYNKHQRAYDLITLAIQRNEI